MNIAFEMRLKIIFVLVLIFTGLVVKIYNILDFSQPKKVKRLDTCVISLIKIVVYIETLCKYF